MAETREQIIELADELIRTRGFNAFSYSDISGPLAIRNSAVHYHFPTKVDLGEAVIEAELQRVADIRRELGGLPGDEQLKA
ncbi:MAG TPA: TetR/AcrR family transcriptional regulator, partial [Puia sp.]